MAKIVVLGVEGDDGLWIADLDAGTVSKITSPATGDLKAADDLRKAGAVVVKGVNLAALAKSADSVSGGFLDVSGGFLDN
ncbi:hypothetical protein B5M44_01100 [Shinella sumterensis]|jgi:hypothetical protein|uniref:hypothetical protein n=1 Tax=Shinella sumterensis TaxID=1967501 RepID=UPI00106DEDA4|nr:hypothetical protein [Shinella sumterensis]MCD1262893.1 hypothetical protein [Shinella sumterensis]TFF00326.1 hypothetical protein B5M44_01100 [Shinella sumterensis]